MRVLALIALAVAVAAVSVEVRLSKTALKLGDYEDPYTTKCAANELNVTLEGVPGAFCSPPCTASGTCPAGGSGSVQAECALEVNGASTPTYCALICTPGQAGCPKGATCQAIQGVGVCTYLEK